MKRVSFSPTGIRRMSFVALASLAVGLFIKLTWELKEDSDLGRIDETILILIGKLRLTALNGPMVDVTAIGSATVAFFICLIGIVILWLERDRRGAVFFLISVAGAGVWSTIIKLLVHRERPTIIPRLVEVADFSYPSGHTIVSTATFLTLALLASRHFTNWRARVILFLMATALIGLIAFSRLYLGAHYPSDVLSGVLLGTAWSFGLAAVFFSRSSQQE